MSTRNTDQDSSNRAKLLHAAIDAFAEKGFDGASLRAIADNAEVSFQLIAHYFGSKEELWQAALNHQYAQYLETGKSVGFTLSGNIFEQFRNHLRLLLTDLMQRSQLRKIWVQEELANSQRFHEHIKPQIQNLFENLILPYFAEVVRLGIVGAYTPYEVATVVSSVAQLNITWPYYARLVVRQPSGSAQSIEQQVDLMFRILTAGTYEQADEIDTAARASLSTPYQDQLSRLEADIAELKKLVATQAQTRSKK
jgi:AcrR family transcriptional regulator